MDALEETRRVMKDGGWIYVVMREATVGEEATPEALVCLFDHAKIATAGPIEAAKDEGQQLLRGIFRKVDGRAA